MIEIGILLLLLFFVIVGYAWGYVDGFNKCSRIYDKIDEDELDYW